MSVSVEFNVQLILGLRIFSVDVNESSYKIKLFIPFLNIAKGPSTLHVIHSFDWCLQVEGVTTNGDTEEIEEAMEALEIIPVAPTEIPSPHPPSCRKKDLYVDPSQFNDIDEQTIKVDKILLNFFV